jgi:signal transduction protein with GAF and PtsI domain
MDPSTDSVVARFVAGPAAQVLQGLRMKVDERLTGWVAGNAQPIMNSEATLDLGNGAALANLDWCLALPLMHDDRVIGVLSLYSPTMFGDEQFKALKQVAPHLAQMFAAVSVPQAHVQPKPTLMRGSNTSLRMVG